jgi:hypothetical protein
MSSPETPSPGETSLEEVTTLVDAILIDRPWEIEEITDGFTREIRAYAAPLLDGSTVTVQDIKSSKDSKYIITREGLGEITSWGWFADIENLKWVYGTRFALQEAHHSPRYKTNQFSANGIDGEHLKNLKKALKDAKTYKARNPETLIKEKRIEGEYEQISPSEVNQFNILGASYDSKLEGAVMADSLVKGGLSKIAWRKVSTSLMRDYELSPDGATEAIDIMKSRAEQEK